MNELIDNLPAIYREVPVHEGHPQRANFLNGYLHAFEKVLFDGEDDFPSISSQIEKIPAFFDPSETRADFLPWLGAWIGLVPHPELNVARRRKLVEEMAHVYRLRGTTAYLEAVLQLYLEAKPTVSDTDLPGLQIGLHSTVGEDTYLGGGPPFLFHVVLKFSRREHAFVERQTRLAQQVLEVEKPAHTWFKLTIDYAEPEDEAARGKTRSGHHPEH